MNLNSYLPLPTAPRAASPLANSPAQGPASGVDAVAGQSLGLDFAQIMARQFQQLPASQRQNFAATSDAIHADNAQASEHSALLANKDAASQADNQDKPEQKNNSRVSQDAPGHAKDDKQESSAKSSSGSSQRSKKPADEDKDSDSTSTSVLPQVLDLAAKAANAVGNVLTNPAAGLQAARTAANLATQELGQASTNATNKLQMFALSPKVHIITDPRQAPSPESLTAFAKSMGLDDATIQNLMGSASANASTADATKSGLQTGLANGQVNGSADGFNISALLGAALNGGPDKGNMSQADAPAFNQAMTQALASGARSPAASANLLQSAAAAPLNFGISGLPANGLSQAEMASIQHIQMTVLPPAVLPVQSGNVSQSFNTPSTASVLSLLGGNVQEQDIASLASSFSQDMGQQSGSSGSDTSGESSSSGFAQALAQSTSADSKSIASKDVDSAVATPMSEVYDQLSDKLATEMAARMHKQLSDGQWKMKFGLRPAHLGGVEIQLEMKDGKLDAVFRAENAMTRDLLQNSTQRLRDALQNFGINAGFVQVGQNGGQSQQNASGNSTPQPQVRDNSGVNTNNNDTKAQVVANRGKDSASLLDLYA
jgi:flagellar hook-length control protein FliK